jgi:hypothetical protein
MRKRKMILYGHHGREVVATTAFQPANATQSPVEIIESRYRIDNTPLIGDELNGLHLGEKGCFETAKKEIGDWLNGIDG